MSQKNDLMAYLRAIGVIPFPVVKNRLGEYQHDLKNGVRHLRGAVGLLGRSWG